VVGQRVERVASRELLDATSQMLDATELEPLTVNRVQQMSRNTARMAGLEKACPSASGAALVRYAANSLAGMNPIKLADVLGHSSLRMIQGTHDPPGPAPRPAAPARPVSS